MFATLILQLPTEEVYEGGELVDKHSNEEKKFDCHLISAVGFCYTAFFADCLHELRKIVSGTRLCLAFNLVKGDSSLDPVHREYGDASPRGYWDHDCDDARHHSMHEVEEASIEFERWIGLDDKSAHAFKDLEIDMETEVVGKGENPFGSEADERGYEGHTANSGPTLDLWYHTAMLVVRPQARSISIACEAGVGSLESDGDGKFRRFIDSSIASSLHQDKRAGRAAASISGVGKNVSSRSINYKYYGSKKDETFKVGVRTVSVAKAIADAIRKFGWKSVFACVIDLVKEFIATQGEALAEIAKTLISTGKINTGKHVASVIAAAFEARIAELESKKMPAFTWCQPFAKVPDFPDIENFLRGPDEKYVHRGLSNIYDARWVVTRSVKFKKLVVFSIWLWKTGVKSERP
ncbi:unnamed protein product [Calypogeia fissa]